MHLFVSGIIEIDRMSFHEILALGVSFIAVIISVHTKLRLRKKKKLANLANDLREIQEIEEKLVEYLNNPWINEDTDLGLDRLANEVLACYHEANEGPYIVMDRLMKSIANEEENIDSLEQGYNYVQNGEFIYQQYVIETLNTDYEKYIKSQTTDPLRYAVQAKIQIESIQEEHATLVNDFDSSLVGDMNEWLDEYIRSTINNYLETRNGVLVNPEEYDNKEEIMSFLFTSLYKYEGINADLQELDGLLERLDDVRTTILQTSYP